MLEASRWRTFPAYRLTAGPRRLGVATMRWSHSQWLVTHDSLHLEWSMENYMISADMLVDGDALRGRMHSETDAVVPNPPTTAIEGRRIPCTAPR